MSEERLQKILARAGIASRRAAEELILAGRVEIDGKVVRELGTKAEAGRNQIRVDGKAIVEPEADVYYLLYKPERVVTTLSDPEGRECVGDFLRSIDERVFPVGRLDYDAEGVLLLTSDGGLAHKLTHPRWGVKRTYLAKVKGDPTPEVLERLVQGVRLEDGKARALEATFERSTEKNTWIRLVVAEGRPHLVKRLCEAVGHPVVRLFRSDYAGITVEGMKPGDLRPLSAAEKRMLQRAVEKEAPLPPGGLPRRRAVTGRGVRDPILGTAPRRAAFADRRSGARGAEESRGGFGARGASGGGRSGARGAEESRGGFGARGASGGGRSGARGGEESRGGFGARGASGGGRSGARGAEDRSGARDAGVRERTSDDWSWSDLEGFGEESGPRAGSLFGRQRGGAEGGRSAGAERGREDRFAGGAGPRRGGARATAGRGAGPAGRGGRETGGRTAGPTGRGGRETGGRAAGPTGRGGRETGGRTAGPTGRGGRESGLRGAGSRGGAGGRPVRERSERTSRPRTGGNAPRRPGGRGGPSGRGR